MSTAAPGVPLEEYLNTAYRPDRDYVNGLLEQRNVGRFDHSNMQRALVAWLIQRAERFRVNALPEMRVRVSVDPPIYRVADICCVRKRPQGDVITEPPVLVIEILSPDDTVPETEERIENYLAMGVPFCWLINPKNLDRAWIYEPDKPRTKVTNRILSAGDIIVNLDELPEFRSFE